MRVSDIGYTNLRVIEGECEAAISTGAYWIAMVGWILAEAPVIGRNLRLKYLRHERYVARAKSNTYRHLVVIDYPIFLKSHSSSWYSRSWQGNLRQQTWW